MNGNPETLAFIFYVILEGNRRACHSFRNPMGDAP